MKVSLTPQEVEQIIVSYLQERGHRCRGPLLLVQKDPNGSGDEEHTPIKELDRIDVHV